MAGTPPCCLANRSNLAEMLEIKRGQAGQGQAGRNRALAVLLGITKGVAADPAASYSAALVPGNPRAVLTQAAVEGKRTR